MELRKYLLLILLSCTSFHALFAQIKSSDLIGSWVISKISFKDGAELPDENNIKYMYMKYTFSQPDQMNISWVYHDLGNPHRFLVRGGYVMIKSISNVVVNSLRIELLEKDKLVLLSQTERGYEDPNSIRYEFIKETALQNSLPITDKEVFSYNRLDTIYNESPKVYASFKGEGFDRYIFLELDGKFEEEKRNKRLVSSFIVDKKGVADSLKILESISPEYDKLYIKAFNKARKQWLPGRINGLGVNVRMSQTIEYLSMQVMPSYFSGKKANLAYINKDYELALYYYDEALASHPKDKEHLYKRGICKQQLGNLEGACNDWKKVIELGGTATQALLDKYCKQSI